MFTRLRFQLKIMILALRQGGMRSLVAVSAVALGIAAMMVMISLGAGAEQEMQAITQLLGENLFDVTAGEVRAPAGRGGGWYKSTRLDRDDVKSLREQVPEIRAIVPILEASLPTNFDGKNLVTAVRGVDPEFVTLRKFRVAQGRNLDENDLATRRRVAVVGSFVAERLNERVSLVGETLWISGVPFLVVGQLAEKGVVSGQNEDDQILVPLETARRRLWNAEYLSRLLVQVADPSLMDSVQEKVREILRANHHLLPGVKDDFNILNLIRANAVGKMNSTFLRGMSQIFAAITLTIGGVGVLAVTFLNVKERISEIGLRKAIGARHSDIVSLFIAEACLMSLLGGVAGVVLGWLAVESLGPLTGWKMAIDSRGVFIPLLTSMGLGLIFGVVPALNAARRTPVEALRDA